MDEGWPMQASALLPPVPLSGSREPASKMALESTKVGAGAAEANVSVGAHEVVGIASYAEAGKASPLTSYRQPRAAVEASRCMESRPA